MKIKNVLSAVLLVLGIVMIGLSVTFVILSVVSDNNSAASARYVVEQIHYHLPNITDGKPEEKSDPRMPATEINGKDFVGIIEVPGYSDELPVHANWNTQAINSYPAVYTGSIYTNNLVIGGNSKKGQFDFMGTISENDTVYFTDLSGQRYKYTIDEIEITNDVSTENLISKDADLVLFARDNYSFKYTIVSCVL